MSKKVLALLMVVAVAGVALGSLWLSAPGEADASTHSATRSISPTVVDPGDTVTVTIIANNYGRVGRIVDTPPGGPTQTIRLLAAGPQTRHYTFTAPSEAGSHSFSGTFSDEARDSREIGGDSMIRVRSSATPEPDPTPMPEPQATRSLSRSSVPPGGQLTVTIVARDYGRVGRIVETLPTGLSSADSQTVTFRFLEPGPQTVSYTVTASETAAGRYSISGVLEDETKEETLVGTSIVTVVVAPEPEPEPQENRVPAFPGSSTTRSIDENSASGANVGAAVRATDRDGDTLTYSLTGTDAGSFSIGSRTGQVTVGTGTILDYETKASYTVTVSATDGSASDTISVAITVVNMDEVGVVTITPDTTPQVGTELTASLEDPDGSVENPTWQWQKDDGQGNYTDILGATMMSYTLVMADDGSRLRAMAMYADAQGPNKTAYEVTASAVVAMPVSVSILAMYDADNSGFMERSEAAKAVLDYLIRHEITRAPAIEVVTAYHLQTPLS